MAGTFTAAVWAELNKRHAGDVARSACDYFDSIRAEIPGAPRVGDPLGVVCFERSRYRVGHHYMVADGANPADRELVYAVAMQQGLETVYADLRKSSSEDWCVVVASLQ